MTNSEPTDKFIAYLDVLGWKSLVRASEEGSGLSPSELSEIETALGSETHHKSIVRHGPEICPEAPHNKKDIDFRITRFSDCVLISTEISSAGIINLISHCWTVCFTLLLKGIMCRGYVKRGQIYHTSKHEFGTGFNDVVEREKQVSIFKNDINEIGTPFIEVDAEIVQYIEDQPDPGVKEMFSRMTKSEGGLTAIFPFQRLNHSFTIGGFGKRFEPDKERESLNNIRNGIHRMKEQVQRHIDQSGEFARRKGDHYIRMLDAQLTACEKTEQALDRWTNAHRISG